MTTTEPIVNSLLNRLTETRARLRAIETERDRLLKDVTALEHVVQMYTGVSETIAEPTLNGLANMTLGQALVTIAKENKGNLNVVQAKRRLLQAGKLLNNKNASPRLYSHLARDPHFERVAPGQFRLIETTEQRSFDSFVPVKLVSMGIDNA